MRICILGLDCAAPEVVFGDERLVNIRRLMDAGVYGRLESVVPPITVPAWMCMSTSQDPGSLGVYGFRNRSDYSYEKLGFANSSSIKAFAMWDQLALEGLKSKITELVGEYPVDVKNFRTDRKDWLRDEIFRMSRKQWEVVHWLMREQEWDYFHYVDIGLDRVHHGFWNYFDKKHVQYEPGSPYENVIPDYYRWLDEQIGRIMESLDEETILLLVSDHGATRLDGGFAVNQWLIQEDLLVLNQYPKEVTSFNKLDVDWSKTRVWSEGGYYARVFFNVQGREPQGTISPAEYERFRDEMKARFEALADDKGRPLNSLVFKPNEIYRNVRNVAPDLIVHFGGLSWRSIGTVGYPRLHVQENDTGPDACNHAQFGMFVLSAPNSPLSGMYEGARLLDIAPTLLDLAGHDIPESMQGRSLVAGMEKKGEVMSDANAEQIIHDRLAGLGYV